MERLIECVPNFSEGQNLHVIKQITDEIEQTEGVHLLNVDAGKDTNRTVVTFAGTPEAVCEAAFLAIKKASELIDMSRHTGKHPRMGATDVCPLIPVSGISMEETAEFVKRLGARVAKELGIPVYLYEKAQANAARSNLSVIRAGEYEGFFKKIKQAEWKPDFGPVEFPPKSGATVIGAREFLVAYNINLNTTSVRRANAVAFDVREAGRIKPVPMPGTLKSVKAIGWFIEEYGIAQISMNLTNTAITPVHIAFEEVCKKAHERGMRVTGSELVGLIPLQSLLDAGIYFLKKQQRSVGVSEKELIKIAIKSLGLGEIAPFKPEERILEYLLKDRSKSRLVSMTLTDFMNETASESPAPGGGSISAYMGALGMALGTMVANLSAHKPGWDERWEEFSVLAEKGQKIQSELLKMVDEDTLAFNMIMSAFGLPKSTDEEKRLRDLAIQEATLYATEVPLKVMEFSFQAMPLIKTLAETGNPNSVTDAGVGALCARSAVIGAHLNVRINAKGLDDKKLAGKLLAKGEAIEAKAREMEILILQYVDIQLQQS
jgi:glutamate formiminotransferase/formiminotetrahydrofolate cyclodeaminase